MGPYRKGIVALTGGVLTAVAAIWGDSLGLPDNWPETALAVVTPLLVYLVPNDPQRWDPQ